MIEDSIWAAYPPDVQTHLKRCMAEIAQSGILKRQATLELQRVAEGDPTQGVEDLCKEILRVRADTRGLILMHDYGRQLTQELEQRNES